MGTGQKIALSLMINNRIISPTTQINIQMKILFNSGKFCSGLVQLRKDFLSAFQWVYASLDRNYLKLLAS